MPKGVYKKSILHKKAISDGMKRWFLNGGRNGFLGKKFSSETIKLFSERRGEKSPRWKGGLNFRKKDNSRNDSAYNEWSRQIKKRDKGICRLKSEKCMGYKIVHHILAWRDYPEERYNLNNGITLCQYHHPLKRVEEQKMIPILNKLVSETLI